MIFVAVLVLTLLVGGLGWKAKWHETLFKNEKVERIKTEDESEAKTDLVEGLDRYNEDRDERRDHVNQGIDEIREAGAPTNDPSDGLLARARRSDDAWRSGVERLCPECAPGVSGDSAVGSAEGM